MFFKEGQIIDATFIEAPIQHNTHEENKTIKKNKGDSLWNEKPHKKSHKDVDARWTKKRNETHYGYKGHVKVDKKSKLVKKYGTTVANMHDSKFVEPLLEEFDKGQDCYCDAGYVGRGETIRKHGANPVITEKGSRNHKLNKEQRKSNRIKSKSRCRVEHVFGFIQKAMTGCFVRTIGFERAKAQFSLTCLIYNAFRYSQICIYHKELLPTNA